jgi:hypothetical protein
MLLNTLWVKNVGCLKTIASPLALKMAWIQRYEDLRVPMFWLWLRHTRL